MSKNPRIIITDEAVQLMATAASAALPRETGGVLIGFRADVDVYVRHVIEVPGPASATRFTLKQQPRDRALKDFRSTLPGDSILGYVGTWHSHPAPAGPSPMDRATFARECLSAPDVVAMMVFALEDQNWISHGVTGIRLRTRQTAIEVVSQ